MSIVKVKDELDIEIKNDLELKEATDLLFEICCLEENDNTINDERSIKNSLIRELMNLISIYNGDFKTMKHDC